MLTPDVVDAGAVRFSRAELNEWLAGYGITGGHWRRVEIVVGQSGADAGLVYMRVERAVRDDDGKIVGHVNVDTGQLEPLTEILAFRVEGMP